MLGTSSSRLRGAAAGPSAGNGALFWLRALLGALLLVADAGALPVQATQAKPARDEKAEKPIGNELGKSWSALTAALLQEYALRHPDRALQWSWPRANAPGAGRVALGAFGTEGAIRWKDALEDAQAELARLEPSSLPPLERSQRKALQAWVESELLLLDSQGSARSDPSGYVQRVTRILRAVLESSSIPEEERGKKLAALFAELPAYWGDAQKSLVAPCPEWIDVALHDLADLQELVERIGQVQAPASQSMGATGATLNAAGARAQARRAEVPLASIEAFRHWLLDTRARSANAPNRMSSPEWTRLVRLASGSSLTRGEIKSRCLRDLAAVETGVRTGTRALKAPDVAEIALGVQGASARALALAKHAKLLRTPIAADAFEVACSEGARTGTQVVLLRGKDLDAGILRASIELPSAAWSSARATTRLEQLLPRGQIALGVRYGLTGEALLALSARMHPGSLAAFAVPGPLGAGFGLYALEWVPTLNSNGQGFPEDPKLAREFALLRGLEAVRLLAALELHAEGVSLTEAAGAFRRRTGVDEDTALAETMQALRDPTTGLSYLVLIELRALVAEEAREKPEREALARVLMLATQHPELRPADMREVLAAGLGGFER